MQFDCWLPTGRRRDDRQEDMTLRIGIVGCGKIADAHIEQIRAIGGAEVVALCDTEPLMARQLGARFGIASQYSNLVEMLGSQKLDVVHITTPPNSHVAIALQAIAAGCHVFVEKPFALDAAGGRTILEAARNAGRKVSINYWYNFEPPSDELRALIARGVLGEAVHVDSILGYDLSGDYGTAVLGDAGHWVHSLPGKLFHNVLDHVVSKMVLFLPDEEPTVSVLDYRRRPASGNAVLDAVADELRFLVHAGSVSAFGMISAQARPAAHLLRVHGTRNTIEVDYNNRTVALDKEQRFPSALGRLEPAFARAKEYRRSGWRNLRQFRKSEFHYFQGMRKLLEAFYTSIRQGTAPPIAYEEMLRVTTIIDRVNAGLLQNVPVGREAVRP